VAVATQPAGESRPTYSSPSWSSQGDQVLKVTPLNWGFAQAAGGKICLELTKDTNMDTFCLGSYPGNCW
jgi:hypothetical protein